VTATAPVIGQLVIAADSFWTSAGVAALVAAIVSLLGHLLGEVIRPLFIENRVMKIRQRLEHEAAQRRDLRALTSMYHGRLLEMARDWNHRMWQLYEPDGRDGRWLTVTGRAEDEPSAESEDAKPKPCAIYEEDLSDNEAFARFVEQYMYRSYVFRFLAVCGIARKFEAQAFLIDSRVAEPTDLYLLKYAKAFMWVMTAPSLHHPEDDGMPGRDHFRNDEFRPMLDACYDGVDVFDVARFHALVRDQGERERLWPVFDFFDGLRYDEEDRYRWDRLVAFHLLLMAYLETIGDDLGYNWRPAGQDNFKRAAQQFHHGHTARNLLKGVQDDLGLVSGQRRRRWSPARRRRHEEDAGGRGARMLIEALQEVRRERQSEAAR
jgi:hypothetical protein